MLGRFTVRPSDDGSNRFGVWDGAVNGWRAIGIDDEAEAHRIASDLDIQYDAHGPRPADAIRKVDPAQPVQRAQWQNGEDPRQRRVARSRPRQGRSGHLDPRLEPQANLTITTSVPFMARANDRADSVRRQASGSVVVAAFGADDSQTGGARSASCRAAVACPLRR
jgi:hypothetical protein